MLLNGSKLARRLKRFRFYNRQISRTRHAYIAANVLPTVLLNTFVNIAVSNSDLRRGRKVIQRHDFEYESHVRDIGPDLFRRLYRVSVGQFCVLRELLKPHLERKKKRYDCAGSTPTVEAMLCITLRILAGASYLDVGWPYGVGRATTFTIFDETLMALSDVLPALAFPTTESECQFHADQFQKIRGSRIDGIIAALDGIAIEITQPDLRDTPDPRKYYNRKGFYAICVQAAVGADYSFLFVSARHAGGTHDSTAFQDTKLHNLLDTKALPEWVIIAADDAYSNGFYILTPYSGLNLSSVKDTFNYYLSSCRMTVEQAFGMLVSRFGIFWSPLRFGLSKDTLILMVCCKLHNFIIANKYGDEYTTLSAAGENNVRGTPTVQCLSRYVTYRTEQSAISTKKSRKLFSSGSHC